MLLRDVVLCESGLGFVRLDLLRKDSDGCVWRKGDCEARVVLAELSREQERPWAMRLRIFLALLLSTPGVKMLANMDAGVDENESQEVRDSFSSVVRLRLNRRLTIGGIVVAVEASEARPPFPPSRRLLVISVRIS